MIKTVCLLALIAFASTQSNNAVLEDSLTNAGNAIANSAATSTIGQIVSNPSSVVENANLNNVPALNKVVLGYGNREVVVTPANAVSNAEELFDGNQEVNIERMSANEPAGEWALDWSVENGDNYALWNQNGQLVIADLTTGNVEDNLGFVAGYADQVGAGIETIVDDVYNSEVHTVSSAQAGNWLQNLLSNNQVSNFLQQNNDETLAQAASNAAAENSAAVNSIVGSSQVAQAIANPQAAINQAVADPQAAVAQAESALP